MDIGSADYNILRRFLWHYFKIIPNLIIIPQVYMEIGSGFYFHF